MSSPDVVLGPNQYGKAEARVVRVERESPIHELIDLDVSSMLRGDFTDCYTSRDNSAVIATDTQKNTVYAFAKEHGISTPEEFLLLLGRHFTAQDEVRGGAGPPNPSPGSGSRCPDPTAGSSPMRDYFYPIMDQLTAADGPAWNVHGKAPEVESNTVPPAWETTPTPRGWFREAGDPRES